MRVCDDMVRFLRTAYRQASSPHGLPIAVLVSRVRAGLVAALRRDRVSAQVGEWVRIARRAELVRRIVRRPVAAVPPDAVAPPSGPAPDAERAGRRAQSPDAMQNFADLIANAVKPSMSRDERERVYGVVRQAVLRLHPDRTPLTADPQIALQLHLVEETIRDLEAEIARHNAMERMRRATEAQAAEIGLPSGRTG